MKRISRPKKAPALEKNHPGISCFDDMPGGGLPTGRSALVCGSAGSGESLLTSKLSIRGATEANCGGPRHIEAVDLTRQPRRTRPDQIFALPALLRKLPKSIKRLIGGLSNAEPVMIAIGLQTPQQNL
jgi:circadian clock protein KaiB